MDLKKELIFASNNKAESMMIRRYVDSGKLVKLAPKVYTTNLKDSPQTIIRRNLVELLAWRFPGCILSHRSAQTLTPTEKGNVWVTYTFTKRIEDYPGLVINVLQGPSAINSDIIIGNQNVYIASEYRWMLEVMQPARKGKDGDSKALPRTEIEHRLENMLVRGGETALNDFRDKLRSVANELNMQLQFEELNKIIAALLLTHDAKVLVTKSGKARAAGNPVDAQRLELFEQLFKYLSSEYFPPINTSIQTEQGYQIFAFFESYFSNYIEGTIFEVNEAKQIVDSGVPLLKRREDSHDILGTYRLVSNQHEMSLTPKTENEFIESLRYRHRVLLSGREDMQPGMFKNQANRAGNTLFVLPELVEGTLRYGFRYYIALQDPFAKAVMMHFLVSEVHPFNDGNGRTARVMMNAELVAANQNKIIIPSVYRDDYILSLKKLSRQGDASVFVQVLQRMQVYSNQIPCSSFDLANEYLTKTNAYQDPDNGKLIML